MSILKRVPNYKLSWNGVDARRQFFIDNADSEKYYYMPVGDYQFDRNRNTLVPLGTFLGFFSFDRQIPIRGDEIHSRTNYGMRFSNPPYNSESQSGPIHMDTDPLVYTDHTPGAGSVPLHYYDYIQLSNPQLFDENGRPKPEGFNAGLPTAFGDGENGNGSRTFRPPGYETEQLRNSRVGAQNFVAKKGGKKTRNHKNRKSKKTKRKAITTNKDKNQIL